MIIKSQFSARSEFYFACLEAKVNGWNLQISDKRTTHLSENINKPFEIRKMGHPIGKSIVIKPINSPFLVLTKYWKDISAGLVPSLEDIQGK